MRQTLTARWGGWQAVPTASLPLLPPRARRCIAVWAAQKDDDVDVAVFRFTLGIPGFDDALIPRVVGVLGVAALLLNHVLSEGVPSGAQERTEALGAVLAAVCIVAPTLEQRIKELDPGRGRRALPDALDGAVSCFALPSDLSDSIKQELAWASYALMKNSNICGLLLVWRGRALLCRGLLGTAALGPAGATSRDKDAILQALTQAWAPAQPALASFRSSSSGGSSSSSSSSGVVIQQGAYWPDRGAVRAAGAASWAFVPEGAQGVLLQPLLPDTAGKASSEEAAEGALLLLCDRPRALNSKERAWAAAVAAKLQAVLSE